MLYCLYDVLPLRLGQKGAARHDMPHAGHVLALD